MFAGHEGPWGAPAWAGSSPRDVCLEQMRCVAANIAFLLQSLLWDPQEPRGSAELLCLASGLVGAFTVLRRPGVCLQQLSAGLDVWMSPAPWMSPCSVHPGDKSHGLLLLVVFLFVFFFYKPRHLQLCPPLVLVEPEPSGCLRGRGWARAALQAGW